MQSGSILVPCLPAGYQLPPRRDRRRQPPTIPTGERHADEPTRLALALARLDPERRRIMVRDARRGSGIGAMPFRRGLEHLISVKLVVERDGLIPLTGHGGAMAAPAEPDSPMV